MFHDAAKAEHAAEAMRVIPTDLKEMKIIDRIVPEPVGGAHSDFDKAAAIVKQSIKEELATLDNFSSQELIKNRVEKYAQMGVWKE